MNKKIVISIIVILVVVIGAFYLFKPPVSPLNTSINTKEQTPSNTMPTTQYNTNTQANTPVQTQSNTSPQTYNVSIMNYSFNPGPLTINKGDTVVWTNNDTVPHQVKGNNLSSLSAPVMSNGQTYSFTFNDSGTFNYHCAIHPSMTGSITVK